jgi:hypothetical protein
VVLDVRGGVVKVLPVAPDTGVAVLPEFPRYHWKVGEVPEAAMLKVAVEPLAMETDPGWVVKAGGIRMVIVAAFESTDPSTLVTRAQ